MEMLRQPLENGLGCISLAAQSLTFPASFMLVAAMNPCPSGYLGDLQHGCSCTPAMLRRYRTRLSRPLLDRIALQVEVPRIAYRDMSDTHPVEASSMICSRVERAISIQQEHLGNLLINCNSRMGPRQIHTFCRTDAEAQCLLRQVPDRLGLSTRTFQVAESDSNRCRS